MHYLSCFSPWLRHTDGQVMISEKDVRIAHLEAADVTGTKFAKDLQALQASKALDLAALKVQFSKRKHVVGAPAATTALGERGSFGTDHHVDTDNTDVKIVIRYDLRLARPF